jgi:hypothetical protein
MLNLRMEMQHPACQAMTSGPQNPPFKPADIVLFAPGLPGLKE